MNGRKINHASSEGLLEGAELYEQHLYCSSMQNLPMMGTGKSKCSRYIMITIMPLR